MRKVNTFFVALSMLLATTCQQKQEFLFDSLNSSSTNIDFNNQIIENEFYNILTFEYFYNGGGVGVGDFNNDGLSDIFFSGNIVSNKLYLNQGDLSFTDISSEAGIEASDKWCTGVSVVDINHDGWLDLYLCTSVYNPDKRGNILFINQGVNESGVPVFVDKAEEYGIADTGFSIQGVFFDYDNDEDLDLYVLTNQVETISPNRHRVKINNGTSPSNDRLYRNNGDGTFTNTSMEAGIFLEGYGLGISVQDFNQDGWKDLYITNDYMTNDVMLINNRDGTFTNRIRHYIKHQNHSAMGHDVADINNDGLPDIISLDMVPEDVQYMKRTMMPTTYDDYVRNKQFGYEHQYIRNVLQLNNGPDSLGNHIFSEISLYADVFATYWSWAPLFADYDNDGLKDLFISNGFPKDVTDMDFGAIRYQKSMAFEKETLLERIPESKAPNFLYRNVDGISFEKKTREWGLGDPSFSNGAVFSDLDNDGDLDIVTNNINQEAFIYRNNLRELHPAQSNYLRIRLNGPERNPMGIGSKITVWADGEKQYLEYSPYRGYKSSVEPYIHFGLGTTSQVDSILVVWPNNTRKVIGKTPANQIISVEYDGGTLRYQDKRPPGPKFFREASESVQVKFKHFDDVFIDFNIQLTIPHQFSQYGPSVSVGDINGDSQLDFFLGGSLGTAGTFYIQQDGIFTRQDLDQDDQKKQEDLGTLLFDADLDGDLDLYIVSGSYEQALTESAYTDRFYENDGSGNFLKLDNALPEFLVSGSCVKAADYDQDGDLDLFVGGRLYPGKYPMPVSSFLLENISEAGNIRFRDATAEDGPDLTELGLVMDALWTDFNNDHQADLVIAGEWMPLTFLENRNGKLVNITGQTGISEFTGLWRSLAGADFDNDGDIDYVAGNLGENSFYKASLEEPMVAYADDYDNNGMTDIIMGRYFADVNGKRDLYPVHSADDLLKQVPVFKGRFESYADYGYVTLDEVFTDAERSNSYKINVTCLSTSYIENLGNGTFRLIRLPSKAQFAPIYSIMAHDVNEDNLPDIILTGNDFGNNPYWGRYDAFNGLVLLNDGDNEWKETMYPESGFFVPGDGKSLGLLPLTDDQSLLLATQNQDSLRVFTWKHHSKVVDVSSTTASAILYQGNSRRKVEFYYGHSFLSQSARVLYIPEETDSVVFFDYTGKPLY